MGSLFVPERVCQPWRSFANILMVYQMISHAIVALLSLIVLIQEKRADLPIVELSYAELFDISCSQQTKYTINSSWVSEIRQRLSEFRSAWEHSGPALLQATQDIIGEPFV